MSLLMDALKKAEQAKAQQRDLHYRSSADSEAPLPEEGERLPEPQALASRPEPLPAAEADQEAEAAPEAQGEGELSLSLDEVEVVTPLYLDGPEQIPAEAGSEAVTTAEVAPEPESPCPPDPPGPEAPAADIEREPVASATPPPADAGERGVAVPPPGQSGVVEAAPAARAEPSPPLVSPLSVGKRPFNRTYLWAGLVVVMALAGIAYYLMALLAPLPSVATDAAVVAPAPPAADESGVGGESAVPPPAIAEQGARPPAEAPPSREGAAATSASPHSSAVASAAPQVEAAARELRPPPPAATPAPRGPAAAPPSGAKTATASERPLQIERRVAEDPLFSQLQQAYSAYQAGDLDLAEQRYRQVLQRDGSSRDALLGLAAIAQRGGRYDDARSLYRRLLQLNPKDSAAAAALMALSQQGVASRNISQLKLMLAEEPDAAHLHFALGNEYAARGQWPEAQQAYFDAWRYAPGRGEYAFNLAVSLEHLGQPRAALSYYLKAQSGEGALFDTVQLAERIAVLRAAGGR